MHLLSSHDRFVDDPARIKDQKMVRLVWLQLGRLESMTTKRELDPMQRKERKEEGKDGKKEE